MDNLSRFDSEFLGDEYSEETAEEKIEDKEDEENENAFEVIYREEEIELLYNDYREIAGEPGKTENEYLLAMKNERKIETHTIPDFEAEEEPENLTIPKEGKDYEIKMNLLKVEYEEPVFFNDQLTYQSIFMENNEHGKTVYELTLEAAQKNGMDVKISYDEKTRTFYLDSMDGKEDGADINGEKAYLEFWIKDGETGEYQIGENSIEQEVLKKGDRVEWRLATERESGCGGGGYEKTKRGTDEMVLYPNNGNAVRGYFPGIGNTLEKNPFLYMDLGLDII